MTDRGEAMRRPPRAPMPRRTRRRWAVAAGAAACWAVALATLGDRRQAGDDGPGRCRLVTGVPIVGVGPATGRHQLGVHNRLEGRRCVQWTGLPQPVTAGRDRGIADDAHLSHARAGEPGTMRGDLLLVHLGSARVDEVDVHELA